MNAKSVVFVWPGDLHLESADRPNYTTALWMADEVNELIRPDFVQFAGDNVQHARENEWTLFRNVTDKLQPPWHALVGDHDAHHDPGCHAYQKNVGATYLAYTVNGYRFICLNTMQSRPLGMTKEQVLWFRYEVDSALARDERVVVFQHHYPFQVWEDFAGPGIEEWREIIQTRPITALFAGHTHYGQIANDGRHVYVATRSIGDPEGGPAGYAVVFLDGESLALTYRSVEDKGPVVLITHPRRAILATKPAHIISGPVEARVRAWSKSSFISAQARIDDGEWRNLHDRGDMEWSFPIPGDALAKGEHSLEVRLINAGNEEGCDRITFAADLSGRYNPYPLVDPVVRGTKFC
ncbi:MAG TPA: metallophosphoesterase [Chthoniobacterales bacterium]|nr:metallophosphoesterase [Chthoniobacterales bacterium]